MGLNVSSFVQLTTFFGLLDIYIFLFAVKRTSSAAGFADSDSCAGGSGSTDCRPKRFKPDPELTCDDEDELDAKIAHKNQPVLMTVYRDPVTEQEKVCIVVSLPGGASDVEFSLVGSGPGSSTARITYSWPKILFDIETIFKKAITSSELPVCHPKIIALKNELKNNRDLIDSTPKGSMELTLPISVQTATSSISRAGGKTADGSMVVIVELLAFQNSYTVKQFDKKIDFVDL
ncbi:uncharacterized protein LOC123467161 [Daphnia magna]|uniref:uncharacterized protein LOC123467161 n=1 Tax=Daphnia magna TaxID=35525 RepID=UPI001E1BD7F5|nr:uncharacterized protein LOC123467161 [Daphnia magna]